MTRRDGGVSRQIRTRIMRRTQSRPSTCWTGKIQHPSEHEAAKQIRSIRRRNTTEAEGLTAYRCDSCRKYHIGHGLGGDP